MTAVIARTSEKYYVLRFNGGPKDGDSLGSQTKAPLERYAKMLGYRFSVVDERRSALHAKPFDHIRGMQ